MQNDEIEGEGDGEVQRRLSWRGARTRLLGRGRCCL